MIHHGEVIEANLKRNDFSQHDLLEDLRLNGQVDEPRKVWLAYIERDGNISVVPASK